METHPIEENARMFGGLCFHHVNQVETIKLSRLSRLSKNLTSLDHK
jgi:hypothetical protein